jgi:long-subunit fatty acid transport protein
MKSLTAIINILAIIASFSTTSQAQSIGLKGGYTGASFGYDSQISGNYIQETSGDGSFISVPFQYRLNKYFSVGTEIGFSARNVQLKHMYYVNSGGSQELKTVLREVKTKAIYMPFDANLHVPWKGLELVLSLGLQMAKNSGTKVYDNDEAIIENNGVRLPKELRVTALQSGWTIRGGLQYQFDRITLMADFRLARTFARYAQEYDFDNVPDIPAKIFTGLAGLGVMYQLQK